MGNYHKSAHYTGENEFQLILAAGLIRRFAQISPEEMYQKAIPCFDSLLEIKESRDVASKVSSLIDGTVASVQKTAEAIVDSLLFNGTKNPYLSLGLPENAGKVEAAQRWKRLIVLYHPDKYPGQREYEEKAKKINEAYEEIQTRKREVLLPRPDNRGSGDVPPVINTMHYARYLRRVPVCILTLAILMAILSILFFIRTIQDDRRSESEGRVKTISYHTLHELPSPAVMRMRCPHRASENGGIG
jgi:hypothetical protein